MASEQTKPSDLQPIIPGAPILLKPDQAARLLNMSPGTLAIQRCREARDPALKKRSLPYIIIGNGVIRYRLADVLAYLESRTCSNASDRPPGVPRRRGGPGRPRRASKTRHRGRKAA